MSVYRCDHCEELKDADYHGCESIEKFPDDCFCEHCFLELTEETDNE